MNSNKWPGRCIAYGGVCEVDIFRRHSSEIPLQPRRKIHISMAEPCIPIRVEKDEENEQHYGVLLYYKYANIPDLQDLFDFYQSNCTSLSLLGRVRLSAHGVNVTVIADIIFFYYYYCFLVYPFFPPFYRNWTYNCCIGWWEIEGIRETHRGGEID